MVLECIQSMSGGGAERQLAYLSAPLSARGWTVIAALVAGGPHLETLLHGGARVEWLKARGNHDPRLVTSIRHLIRSSKPSVVHSWLPQMDVIAGVAALTCKVPWVMSERSSGDAFRANIKQRLRVALAKRATAIVANSVGGARFWRDRAPGVPVHLIGNAVDVASIDAVVPAENFSAPPGTRVILAVGRCVPEKNQRLLVEALPLLDRDVVVVICGEGPLLQQTRELAVGLGVIDRVFLAGYVDSVWSWMKRADVFASVGWYEGHPNAVLEAMAARRPVVVSDIEAHREVLASDEAVFVDPSSAADLARGIRRVLECSCMEERVARARVRAEVLSIEAAGAAYDALYRTIAASS